jgi:hypothetical protein
MKSRFLQQSGAFIVASAFTAAGWMLFWPKAGSPAATPMVESRPDPDRTLWNRQNLIELTGELEKASTSADRLKAALRFNDIPPAEIPNALDQVKLIENRELTLAARLLLIRWAARDGEAAANWAWHRFRQDGLWQNAFREISSSWAWNQPAALGEWALKAAKRRKPGDDISLAEAVSADAPLLDSDMLNRVSRDLICTNPRPAFQVFLARGGWRSNDRQFFDALGSVQQVREALLACSQLDKMVPNRIQGDEIHAMGLLERWKKLDPADFARSPYAHLIPDRKPPAPSPIPDGPAGWVSEFEAWKKSAPGARPDMKDWPAAKQQAWEDLEALMPGDSN